MLRKLPPADLAQTMTWIWLGMLAIGGSVFLAYRYWRKRHPRPPQKPEKQPQGYAQRLQRRMSQKRIDLKHAPDGPAESVSTPNRDRSDHKS